MFEKSFYIKNILIKNQLVLAPLSGVSNYAHRYLCKLYGASLVYSEMVSDKGLMYNSQNTKDLCEIKDNESPIGIQLFGSDLESMVNAAKFIDVNYPCDFIDINMGCPVPKVAIKSQAGSALLKNPEKIYHLVKEIVDNVGKPVTVKIRSGWDANSINAVEVAKILEKAGVSAITIHGRTRAQGYTGKANWEIIKQVKEAVKIPVIGNGDVIDFQTAKEMIEYTNCDAIMIGRASIGNPFIFREILSGGTYKPTKEDIIECITKHYEMLVDIKGQKLSIFELRGICPQYIKGFRNAKETRKKIVLVQTFEELINIINQLII
jgi:nifR3 family TIM-barrel protein